MAQADEDPPQHARQSDPTIPGLLVGFLVILGISLLAWGVYLETNQLEMLQEHPILANLLSGVIGFCFGVVVLSAVLGRLVRYFTAVEHRVNRRLETTLALILSSRRRQPGEQWPPENPAPPARQPEPPSVSGDPER